MWGICIFISGLRVCIPQCVCLIMRHHRKIFLKGNWWPKKKKLLESATSYFHISLKKNLESILPHILFAKVSKEERGLWQALAVTSQCYLWAAKTVSFECKDWCLRWGSSFMVKTNNWLSWTTLSSRPPLGSCWLPVPAADNWPVRITCTVRNICICFSNSA